MLRLPIPRGALGKFAARCCHSKAITMTDDTVRLEGVTSKEGGIGGDVTQLDGILLPHQYPMSSLMIRPSRRNPKEGQSEHLTAHPLHIGCVNHQRPVEVCCIDMQFQRHDRLHRDRTFDASSWLPQRSSS